MSIDKDFEEFYEWLQDTKPDIINLIENYEFQNASFCVNEGTSVISFNYRGIVKDTVYSLYKKLRLEPDDLDIVVNSFCNCIMLMVLFDKLAGKVMDTLIASDKYTQWKSSDIEIIPGPITTGRKIYLGMRPEQTAFPKRQKSILVECDMPVISRVKDIKDFKLVLRIGTYTGNWCFEDMGSFNIVDIYKKTIEAMGV